MSPSVHGAFTLRALGALSRLHLPGRTDGALLDLFRLMSLSSSTPREHHETWCRSVGVDPDRVATVRVGSRNGLCRLLGRTYESGSCATKVIGGHLATWASYKLAALRRGVVFIFIPHIIALDPNARRDERAAPPVKWAWGKPSAKAILTALVAASPRAEARQPALGLCTSPADPEGIDPQGISTPLYGDQEEGDGGRARGGTSPTTVVDPLDELVALAEDVAQPLSDGRAYRVPPQARRRLAAIVGEYGVEACRSMLVETAPRYAITHPVGWLERSLAEAAAEPEPDSAPEPASPPAPVVAAVQACLPPGRSGRPRGLSAAELVALAALVAQYGAEAVVAAAPGVAGYALPVRGLAAQLGRRGQARAGDGERAVTGWGRRSRADRRRDTWAQVGRRRPLTPEEEAAQREADARAAAAAAAEAEAWEAAQAERDAQEAADRAAAERAAAERARRMDAERERVRAGLARLSSSLERAAGAGR